jgi:hypothetical protein
MKMKVSISTITPPTADQGTDSIKVAADKLVEKVEGFTSGEELLGGLDRLLTKWVGTKVGTRDKTQIGAAFHSLKPPSISIKRFLQRIHHFFVCSDECYVLALVYIARAAEADSSMAVSARSVHRLLFVATMVAAKCHDDSHYRNSYYAKVGGLPIEEVNDLEISFLKILDWRLTVEPEEYQLYYDSVCPVNQPLFDGEPEPEPCNHK